jgi:hypothetical protein
LAFDATMVEAKAMSGKAILERIHWRLAPIGSK